MTDDIQKIQIEYKEVSVKKYQSYEDMPIYYVLENVEPIHRFGHKLPVKYFIDFTKIKSELEFTSVQRFIEGIHGKLIYAKLLNDTELYFMVLDKKKAFFNIMKSYNFGIVDLSEVLNAIKNHFGISKKWLKVLSYGDRPYHVRKFDQHYNCITNYKIDMVLFEKSNSKQNNILSIIENHPSITNGICLVDEEKDDIICVLKISSYLYLVDTYYECGDGIPTIMDIDELDKHIVTYFDVSDVEYEDDEEKYIF